jgi:nucleoid-associated protein YgaU
MSEVIEVKAGDTLSHIALRHLSDAGRWPEIYGLNAAAIEAEQARYPTRRMMRGPHWIFPGMTLRLPGA